MLGRAPTVYQCPCCGQAAVTRLAKSCRDCGIGLRLEGEIIFPHSYLYLADEKKWVWLDESLSRKPWEDGWKRRPTRHPRFSSWTDRFPGRPTGFEPGAQGDESLTAGSVFIARPPRKRRTPRTSKTIPDRSVT